MSNNEELQKEELEAMSAIYGNQWQADVGKGSYSISITSDIRLYITLSADYPSIKAPTYQLLAPTLTGDQKQHIYDAFHSIYQNNLGSPVLFEWVEKLKEIASNDKDDDADENKTVDNLHEEDMSALQSSHVQFNIVHGTIIKDRKSIFQGHACSVKSQEIVKCIMEELLQNKKIAQATHNILAYRICLENGSVLQDCDDDGEAHAGSRLLHLLQILNVHNVMVVVSRWYGGIHLGPDRFRHINNCARQVLQQGEFLEPKRA